MPIRSCRFWILLLASTILWGCGGPGPGEFAPTEVALVEVPDQNLMELTNDSLTFVDAQNVKWVAPKGTWTDGATVPRLALWITDGRFQKEFLKAAIVHDAYCQDFNEQRSPQQYKKKPWRDVHRMFYEACVSGKTSSLKAKLMFAAVWWGGPRWDDPKSELQHVPDETLRIAYHGSEKWIEDNDPTLQAIESWIEQREPVVVEVAKLQTKFMTALQADNQTAANAALRQSEKRLDEALVKLPDDLMVLNLKGYHHKNLAINYRESEQADKVDTELNKAEKSFQKVIAVEPDDPSALNGLGSVSILRNDLGRAEGYIRKALKAQPEYPEAKHDLKLIEKLRKAE